MKYQMIIDKEEFDKAIQEAELKGYWRSVDQLYSCNDLGGFLFNEVTEYRKNIWNSLVNDIRRGRKHK